ncbi:MAG: YeeE/YedE family protein [Proteobacteria bacterium]|nr:YeeE/YedE family protein [Pseudomonadota bacterium]
MQPPPPDRSRMDGLPLPSVSLIGALVGVLTGYFVRRARLCSFGAIESALIGRDWRRLKVFGIALGVALAGTQLAILIGWLDPLRSSYVAAKLPWLGLGIGAVAFGFGMALVGTCAFGSLVRLGGGDLRSLMTLLIFGAVAFAMLRGSLVDFRINGIEAVNLPIPGLKPSILSELSGLGPMLGLACAVALIGIGLTDRRLWRAPKLLTAGIVLGLGVVAGWLATGTLVDDFAGLSRVQSLTFVAPVARTLFGLMSGAPGWIDFGVASVIGVPVGAFLAARQARDFHWEAYDDAREMRRHIGGAMLMGSGGILASGCTIGQGLTAGSLTAVSWLITVPGLMLGARLGILFLVEDSFLAGLRSRFSVLRRTGEHR